MKPLLLTLALLTASLSVQGSLAAGPAGQNGAALMAMCKGADQVRALSVMCHSYANGFIDAAVHYAKAAGTAPAFCLGIDERAQVPGAIVAWLVAHPEDQKQPAGTVLHRALSARFPCRGR